MASVSTWLIWSLLATPNVSTLLSFGGYTDVDPYSGTGYSVSLTLWFNYSIFTCDVMPSQISTRYSCDSMQWTEIGTSAAACSTPSFKMLVNNSKFDAVTFDRLFFEDTSGNAYGINKFCIPQGAAGPGYDYDGEKWKESGASACGASYDLYSVLCVDNPGDGDS